MAVRLRVFHGLVNYGTQAGLLAEALRQENIYAKSIIGPDIYNRKADFNFKSGGSLIWKIWYYGIYSFWFRTYCLFRFNIFHFYYGTSLFPYHMDLPIIKFLGKKVVHHYLGFDVELYETNMNKYDGGNMKNWSKEKGIKHDRIVKKRLSFESKFSDYKLVCAPKYAQFVNGAEILPLAIDVSSIEYSNLQHKDGNSIRILHVPTDRNIKGTMYIENAVQKLVDEGFEIDLKICEGVSHKELEEEYSKCDFSVVSLIGGWYGQAGVEAMAYGRGIITFLSPEFLEFMSDDFKQKCPIVSANKDSIYLELKKVIVRKRFSEWGLESRVFAEKFHNSKLVALRLIEIYKSLN